MSTARGYWQHSCKLTWVVAFGILLNFVGLSAAGANPARPGHGLLWNRTELPAVFPLQVKTQTGSDYHLTLYDAKTGAAALAAYIEGGRFFKVLVPPGTFILQFAKGDIWVNDKEFFGEAGTVFFTLPDALTFEVRGHSVKAGHLIDLTQPETEILVRDSFICQRIAITKLQRPQEPFDDQDGYSTRLGERGEIVQFPNRLSKDRLSAGADRPIIPSDFAPYNSRPEYDVRQHLC